MRILDITVARLKGLTLDQPLTFFYREGIRQTPLHTVVVGENGAGKSTVLEALTLPSHVNVMAVGSKNPWDDEALSVVKIRMRLSDGANNGEGTEGVVFFSRAKDDAQYLTDHLADDDEISQWSVWVAERYADFLEGLKAQATFNRPSMDASSESIEKLHEAYRANRGDGDGRSGTGRSQALAQWDEADQEEADQESEKTNIDRKLKRQGNIFYINTDQNTFGCGNHILESAKNFPADAAKIFHYRLPGTTADGSLRSLDEINKYWRKIFAVKQERGGGLAPVWSHRRVNELTCDHATGVTKINMNGHRKDHNYDPKYLSSGENEAFFVLSTIVSCRLFNCVLLLDEPELHMHFEQQIKYYRQLHKIFKAFKIQAIVITHSHFVADAVFSNATDFRLEDEPREASPEFRERRSQIREMRYDPLMEQHTIIDDRERIVDHLDDLAQAFFKHFA